LIEQRSVKALRLSKLVFDPGNAVADVKYKIASGEWKRTDMYQLVTFAGGCLAEHAAIIGFSDATSTAVPTVNVGHIRLQYLAWPASAEVSAAEAAGTVVQEVRNWLDSNRPRLLNQEREGQS
jgi:hypothetical protein